MLDPVGTLTLKGKCYNIDLYEEKNGKELATMQVQDEHSLIWRVHLGLVEDLLQSDEEYFIRIMTTEQFVIRIKLIDLVTTDAFPRSYKCDCIKFE